MQSPEQLFWKQAPFARLLPAFALGILIQETYVLKSIYLNSIFFFSLLCSFVYLIFPLTIRHRIKILRGVFILITLTSLGAIITFHNTKADKINSSATAEHAMLAELTETPVEKAKSYKAEAKVSTITNGKRSGKNENMILYFRKENLKEKLQYGTTLFFIKKPTLIPGPSSPGAFDYRKYCRQQGIQRLVWLGNNEFRVAKYRNTKKYKVFINSLRTKIINIIRKNIPGKEYGLAEALLIGYKEDLDKTLLQSYSNTGVIHVIAISGLHLGLIFWLLDLFLKPVFRINGLRLLVPILIILCLWLFTLLAGAQPSVLRSAVMFTSVLIGRSWNKKISMINSLAFSALILLSINPMWLWDAGFQLSYAAVISIVLFAGHFYKAVYIQNPALDQLWKLIAVCLAAQLLTTPISLFHFHQFPNYFLLTNIIAVPLSSLILLFEISLCVFCWSPFAPFIGKITGSLIHFMNYCIETIENLPFPTWNSLNINAGQAVLFSIFLYCFTKALIVKSKGLLFVSILGLFGFIIIRTISFIKTSKQAKVIIYKSAKEVSVDWITGNYFYHQGFGSTIKNKQPDLQATRTVFRVSETMGPPFQFTNHERNFICFHNKTFYFANQKQTPVCNYRKAVIDVLILSTNSEIDINKIIKQCEIRQVVADASVAFNKKRIFKSQCAERNIPFYDIGIEGAFVMNIR